MWLSRRLPQMFIQFLSWHSQYTFPYLHHTCYSANTHRSCLHSGRISCISFTELDLHTRISYVTDITISIYKTSFYKSRLNSVSVLRYFIQKWHLSVYGKFLYCLILFGETHTSTIRKSTAKMNMDCVQRIAETRPSSRMDGHTHTHTHILSLPPPLSLSLSLSQDHCDFVNIIRLYVQFLQTQAVTLQPNCTEVLLSLYLLKNEPPPP